MPALGLIAEGSPFPPSDDREETEDRELRFEWPFRGILGRDMDIPGFAMRASALSKTLPWKAAANELFGGVLGIVACMAGPNAALCGVMDIWVGDMGCEPLALSPFGRGSER